MSALRVDCMLQFSNISARKCGDLVIYGRISSSNFECFVLAPFLQRETCKMIQSGSRLSLFFHGGRTSSSKQLLYRTECYRYYLLIYLNSAIFLLLLSCPIYFRGCLQKLGWSAQEICCERLTNTSFAGSTPNQQRQSTGRNAAHSARGSAVAEGPRDAACQLKILLS